MTPDSLIAELHLLEGHLFYYLIQGMFRTVFSLSLQVDVKPRFFFVVIHQKTNKQNSAKNQSYP